MPKKKVEERSTYHHGDLRNALLLAAADAIDKEGIEALSLRGLARQLGVSHGAPNRHFKTKSELLGALAAHAYQSIRRATLEAAEKVGEDPLIRLNAMGRGYLKWALENQSLFKAMNHPDVGLYVGTELVDSMKRFQKDILEAVLAAQKKGRHPKANPYILLLFTNAIPFGVAGLLSHPVYAQPTEGYSIDELVEQIIELTVPIKKS